ncbi:CPBP family intramembrane glutamic endopeptidase [Microbispora bryophytorum]|uniref:CAAX amino protease n=1 Tax=Microbispora bryophytorum TaxID=1460882 RepID=A0A8H9H0T5_9ACTN|nr:type II CAAX endopeptidase family protein [Microbispora bryophytorum]MBD3136729.1 CPBP family intramembrane metalloprotease [Microbispora bryophytorum]TQS06311.1 CPBP family intramembrane metalloprotease [Microbispora bryophytorum]GGO17439.1 CAAX amino protease [Microbispora bryophytorum]
MNEPQPGPDQAAGPNQLPGPYLAPGPYAGGTAWPAGPPQPPPPAAAQPQWSSSGPYGGPYAGPYPWGPPPRARWVVPPPTGTRYDRLARTASHRWWRPILGTAAIIAVFLVLSIFVGLVAFVISLVTGVPMVRTGTRLFADPVLDLGFQLGVIALLLPLVLGAAWLLQRRPPGSLSSVALRLRWRWLGACLLVALVAVVLGQVIEAMTLLSAGVDPGFRWAGWGEFLPAIIVVLLLVPFQSAAEEYAYRGWIIQGFGAYLRNPWPAILVGAAAFAASHGYTGWGIVYVFAFGMLMGWLAVRTGGLEAPIALHATNNIVAFGVVAASGDMGSAMEQGEVPWESLIGSAVQFAVFGIGVLIIARKWAIQTVSR